MSVFYFVNVKLSLKYEKNNIDYLFQKFLENSIHLYVPFSNLNELNSSGATARILSAELEDDERYIHAKFQDADFFIRTYKEKSNLIGFSIGPFVYCGGKSLLMVVMVLTLHDIFACCLESAKTLLFLH